MFQPDEPEDVHVLDPRESYLFSNCTRHTETLAIILGTPLAALSKVLVQKKLPAANPYLVGLVAGVPVFLATYLTVSSMYFSKVCWGYLRFLPEGSVFKEKLLEAEKKYTTWYVPYNRTRAVHDVMYWDKQAQMDQNWDLSETKFLPTDEKHEIQKQLRWVPSEDYRLLHRIREHMEADKRWDGYRKAMNTVEKGLFGVPPVLKDERIKNAAKPMPKASAT